MKPRENKFNIFTSEFFSTKKTLYFSVDRPEYLAIKKMLVENEISFEQLFRRIVSEVMCQSDWSQKLIKKMAQEKFDKHLARLERRAEEGKLNPRSRADYSAISNDRLYDLINKRLTDDAMSDKDDKEDA